MDDISARQRRISLRSGRRPTRATRVIPVVTVPSMSAPMPTAVPTAAVTQRLAAVVNPRMLAPYLMIAPPPRNPIPTTIWEAIRVGSALTPRDGPDPTIVSNP